MNIEREVNPHFEEYIFNWDYKYYLLMGDMVQVNHIIQHLK